VRLGASARHLLAALLLVSGSAAYANEPGRFDHYVLSLSWSPTYCESAGSRAARSQCEVARPFAFVVHGLWPQYERGWPEFCERPAPFVPEPVVRSMLDIMPSRSLVIHQWRKHGTCAGLDATDYFTATRRAFERIRIPAQFKRLDEYRTVSPGEVEAAFRAANAGLAEDMIAVDCQGRRLTEVQICLDRKLDFTPCEEVDRNACRARQVIMPPTRGG